MTQGRPSARRRTRLLSAAAAVLACTVTLAAQAPAVAATRVARWDMNEPSGATVMTDSSGNNLNGSIGSYPQTGVVYDGATGYRFPFARPSATPADRNRLVIVPDNALLDPGTRNFTVTLRMRTTHSFGNVVQKGQSGTTGGNWKIEVPNGMVTCAVNGSRNRVTIDTGVRVNDGAWHVVECRRTSTAVTVTIDGVVVGQKSRSTGSISNARPLSVGGKWNCDAVETTCDYFSGDIDWITFDVD